jgi:hypothetical protein
MESKNGLGETFDQTELWKGNNTPDYKHGRSEFDLSPAGVSESHSLFKLKIGT